MNEQYLDKNTLLNTFGIINFNPSDLLSRDSYDESEIMQIVKKFSKDDYELLLKSSIHISIIGAGQKSYGEIVSGSKQYQIIDIFKKLNVKFNSKVNEKYDPNQLSARRLTRFFRFHIQHFIETTGKPSYLWRKYSDRDRQKMNICFPGAEHLIESKEDANYLIGVYKKLDLKQNTSFVDRLCRVFDARNISYDL
jgi:hypothetical protein